MELLDGTYGWGYEGEEGEGYDGDEAECQVEHLSKIVSFLSHCIYFLVESLLSNIP